MCVYISILRVKFLDISVQRCIDKERLLTTYNNDAPRVNAAVCVQNITFILL